MKNAQEIIFLLDFLFALHWGNQITATCFSNDCGLHRFYELMKRKKSRYNKLRKNKNYVQKMLKMSNL